MKSGTLILAALVLFVGGVGRARGGFISYADNTVLDSLYGPYDYYLNFQTAGNGTDQFDYSSYKDRPGTYFSEAVTFFSLDYANNPGQVLWGHFDGNDGGIAPSPDFSGTLRLVFTSPVSVVGFRDPGIQPGINVDYYASDGQLIGEVLGSASSFVGAVSTDVPIAYMDISSVGGWQYAISDLRFDEAPFATPQPSSLTLLGIGAVTLMGYTWRRRATP